MNISKACAAEMKKTFDIAGLYEINTSNVRPGPRKKQGGRNKGQSIQTNAHYLNHPEDLGDRHFMSISARLCVSSLSTYSRFTLLT